MKFIICFPLLLSVAVAAPSHAVSIHKPLLTDTDMVHQWISDTITDLNVDMKDAELETALNVNADVEDLDDAASKDRDVYEDAGEDVIVDALIEDKTDQDTDELSTRCPCIIDDVEPVCGSDMRTYRTPCMFECYKKSLGSKGTHLNIVHSGYCYRHSISPYLKIG